MIAEEAGSRIPDALKWSFRCRFPVWRMGKAVPACIDSTPRPGWRDSWSWRCRLLARLRRRNCRLVPARRRNLFLRIRRRHGVFWLRGSRFKALFTRSTLFAPVRKRLRRPLPGSRWGRPRCLPAASGSFPGASPPSRSIHLTRQETHSTLAPRGAVSGSAAMRPRRIPPISFSGPSRTLRRRSPPRRIRPSALARSACSRAAPA
jgi:hypothetical protein